MPPELRDTVRRCNRLYWLGARDAARVSPQHAETVFGVPTEIAVWLAQASLEEVLDLADAPVVTFRLAIAPRSLQSHAPRELRTLHMALCVAGKPQ